MREKKRQAWMRAGHAALLIVSPMLRLLIQHNRQATDFIEITWEAIYRWTRRWAGAHGAFLSFFRACRVPFVEESL
jgi:hypothetical protein